jgi:hypothetical protein
MNEIQERVERDSFWKGQWGNMWGDGIRLKPETDASSSTQALPAEKPTGIETPLCIDDGNQSKPKTLGNLICPLGLQAEKVMLGETPLCMGYMLRSNAQTALVCENCCYYFPDGF